MSDVNPDRHIFGENPGGDVNPHPATKTYHEAKALIDQERAVALNMLKARHQRERDEIEAQFTTRYRQAAASAGFRKEGE